MPLKLIECVLPWLVGSLSEEQASSFLQNIRIAGSVSVVDLLLLLFLFQQMVWSAFYLHTLLYLL